MWVLGVINDLCGVNCRRPDSFHKEQNMCDIMFFVEAISYKYKQYLKFQKSQNRKTGKPEVKNCDNRKNKYFLGNKILHWFFHFPFLYFKLHVLKLISWVLNPEFLFFLSSEQSFFTSSPFVRMLFSEVSCVSRVRPESPHRHWRFQDMLERFSIHKTTHFNSIRILYYPRNLIKEIKIILQKIQKPYY